MKILLHCRTMGLTRKLLPGLFLFSFLTGCSTPFPQSGDPMVRSTTSRTSAQGETIPVDVLELAENDQFGASMNEKATEQVGKVRPGLNLRITVLVAGKQEFNEPSRQVSAQGNLDVPLIGKVQVADLTLQQVEQRLTERFTQYLVNPQVVVEYVHSEGSSISPWGYITVLGRVRAPGKFPIPPTRDLTVSGAIQQAGGFDTSARTTSIRVTRELPGKEPLRLKVDLKAYAKGDLDEDIVLKAGDVIYVPESPW